MAIVCFILLLLGFLHAAVFNAVWPCDTPTLIVVGILSVFWYIRPILVERLD